MVVYASQKQTIVAAVVETYDACLCNANILEVPTFPDELMKISG